MALLFTLPKQVPFTNAGALIPGARLYFYINGTSTPQDTYNDATLVTANTNPVIADSSGRFPGIWLDESLSYKVKLTDASDVEIYTEDDITDVLTAAEVGASLYPQTSAEISASVTPTNYQYPPGNVLRYGTNTTPGTTDMGAAIQAAVDSTYPVQIPYDTYAISDAITLPSNTHIVGGNPRPTIHATSTWTLGANSYGMFTGTGTDDITVENVILEGPHDTPIGVAGGGGGIAGVYIENADNVTVRNIKTSKTNHGIAVIGSATAVPNNLIEDCYATSASSWSADGNVGTPRGFIFSSPLGRIINCTADACATGFYLSMADGLASGCLAHKWDYDNGYYLLNDGMRIEQCQAIGDDFGSGFALAYNERSIIDGCYARNCSNQGFRLHAPQSRSVVTNNIASYCGIGFGMEDLDSDAAARLDAMKVDGNLAEFCDVNGFLITTCNTCSISNNTIYNCQQDGATASTRGGIKVTTNTEDCDILNNKFIDDQGTPTQIDATYILAAATGVTGNRISQHVTSSGTVNSLDPSTANTWLPDNAESEIVTATNVISEVENGKTFYLDAAGGFTSTLPIPMNGAKFRFIVKTAPTTAYIVTTNAGANILYGTINEITATAGVTIQAQDTITFVASTSLVGDWIEVESDGTNWHVRGAGQVDNGITVSVT